MVEGTPGHLEYEVALYKEAPTRLSNLTNELPVDQAVPIGTKLQLRARISPTSGNITSMIIFVFTLISTQ